MSASGNQAAETRNDTDEMITDRPWNIIRIRLPPRKRLPDGSLILSKKTPRAADGTRSRKVTEPTTDNPGKNLITAAVQGEASSNSPRVELCNEANGNTLSKMFSAEAGSDTSGNKLPEGANGSTLSKMLPPEADSDTSGKKLPEGANGSTLSKMLSAEAGSDTSGNKLSEEAKDSMLSKMLLPEAEDNTSGNILPEEASGSTLSKILSAEADSNTIGNKLPQEANDSTTCKNLRVTAGEQEKDASRQGLCEEANNNILIMDLPLPVKVLTKEPVDNTANKNLTTAVVKGEGENKNSPRKKVLYDADNNTPSKVTHEEAKNIKPSKNPATNALKCEVVFEQPSNPIPTKKLSDEANNNGPRNRPTYPVNKKNPRKKRHTSTVQVNCTSQNTSAMMLSTSVGQPVDLCMNAANLEVMKEHKEFDEKGKRTVYLDNLAHQATEAKNNPSWQLAATALKCEVLELARDPIPMKKQSDEAKNNAPRNIENRQTDPLKKNIPRKKLRTSLVQATGTSQNTSGIMISTSVGHAVEQSTNAADFKAMKEYQEFEEKVKRTVYLDNLSHQATEAVIKSALNQFGTLTKVNFVVNYTIPYDIPQSAFVEMETEKDAKGVVNMLHEFPFMISGMPRPVRAKLAMAEMFNDRPSKPGSKLEFSWVGPTDPDYEVVKQFKFTSRRHEVENLALIEHELEEEKLLAEKQQYSLSCNYRMLEIMDRVIMSGKANHLSRVYSVNLGEAF